LISIIKCEINKNNSTYLRGRWTNFSVWAEFQPFRNWDRIDKIK
jgi:hypothetical protein